MYPPISCDRVLLRTILNITFQFGGKHMKYQNADAVFPDALLAEIQKYVQDGMIYIPRAKEKRKKWGENTGCRKYIAERNDTMKTKFKTSDSIAALAGEYNLAVETIKKIVYSK
jgi:sarcosine oxidase delta subunit